MFIINAHNQSTNTPGDHAVMTTRSLKAGNTPSSVYQTLLKQVKKILIEGQARIEAERVRTYWETGRIIHTHILKNKDRADYGIEVIARLARDLGVDKTLLNRCFKFARTYPRLPIGARGHQFSWSHYRKLIAIPDDKERLLIEEKAGRNGWSAEELGARVKIRQTNDTRPGKETPAPAKPLIPARGTLYTYQITQRPAVSSAAEPQLLIDVGFSNFYKVEEKLLSKFSAGDIIESRGASDDYKFYTGNRTPKDLYTYQAYVERVIDGDTLKARVDEGFNMWTKQVLRLRGIDCPEMGTKEGAAAKAFVQSCIKESDRIIIRTSKSDKYDRYLVDVFIPQDDATNSTNSTNSKNPINPMNTKNPTNEVYLNNLLLEKGYARRYE